LPGSLRFNVCLGGLERASLDYFVRECDDKCISNAQPEAASHLGIEPKPVPEGNCEGYLGCCFDRVPRKAARYLWKEIVTIMMQGCVHTLVVRIYGVMEWVELPGGDSKKRASRRSQAKRSGDAIDERPWGV